MSIISENNTLDGFGGWASTENEIDFFNQPLEGEEVVKTDAKSVIDELSKEDNKTPEETDKEVKSETNLFDNFAENVPNLIEDKSKNDEEEKEVKTSKTVSTLDFLKDKGFVNYELEEGEELTEELAEELVEEGLEQHFEERIKDLVESVSDEGKQMIQFLLKGGKLNEFISTLSNGGKAIDINADLESEDAQVKTLRKLLALEDKDSEEIESEIEFLKDSGKLKLITDKKFAKYKAEYNSKQSSLVKQQQEKKESEKEAIKKEKLQVFNYLNENTESNGIKFSLSDKKELPSYMNDKNVKLTNGTSISQMQTDLFYEIPKNRKAMIQLATLLKNRNEDGTFNFESIAKSEKTKVTQEVKQEIRRNKTSIPDSSKSTQRTSEKSLSEYFGN